MPINGTWKAKIESMSMEELKAYIEASPYKNEKCMETIREMEADIKRLKWKGRMWAFFEWIIGA